MLTKIEPPNAKKHNPNPDYLRSLISQITDESLMVRGSVSQGLLAERLGISRRSMRGYLTDSRPNVKSATQIPYCLQYALEFLVAFQQP